jgi:UV DNA damage endonuclease
MSADPMRLGFAVKLMGRPDLKSNDARKHQSNPHLRVSLGYVRDTLTYLGTIGVRMYRMSSDLAPYLTHPDMPRFHNQVAECRDELAEVGALARKLDIRLSFHPSQYILINSPDPKLTAQSTRDLLAQSEMLDAMGQGPEAVVVTHVGGAYGDRPASRARFAEAYRSLPEPVRRRLVLENDDTRFSSADVLWVHEQTGVPLVFDNHHHWCFNPEGTDEAAALRRFVATWPKGVRPKVHMSSPRTEGRELKKGKAKTLAPPVWTGHADFLHPFELAKFLRMSEGLAFDVMIEAKWKELALLRARADIVRFAPEQAARFGLSAADGGKDDGGADEAE